MKNLQFRLTGEAPLLMHNGQTADPLNPFAKRLKEISSKRVKTESDYDQMAKIEFHAALYLNDDLRPCIPGENIEAAVWGKGGAARLEKAGKIAQAGIFSDGPFPIEYDGPKDADGLWDNGSFRHVALVNIRGSKIARTRAIFRDWHSDVEIIFDPEVVNKEQVIHWMELAGDRVGLMDWRPKYGRFSVEVLNGKS